MGTASMLLHAFKRDAKGFDLKKNEGYVKLSKIYFSEDGPD